MLIRKDGLSFDANHPLPQPAPGEARVRVTLAGICRTDLEIVKGYKGFSGVLGHEFVGILDALPYGYEGALKKGARVVAEINCVAPGSSSRTAFDRAQDPDRTTLGIRNRDGVFADYVNVPIENLHAVPDPILDEEAVFAEPLAAACQVLEQVRFSSGQRVIVLGTGKLGLLCAQVIAATSSVELCAIGRHARGLEMLQSRGICALREDEAEGRTRADVIIECTGSAAGFSLAQRLLRPRGTLVLKSTYAAQVTPGSGDAESRAWQEALTRLVVDETTVIGSRCGPFAKALELLVQKQVDVRPLIEARYDLREGADAFAHAARRGALKVLLSMSMDEGVSR